MFKLASPFFIIVETPLHAGSGSDLGIVDLPVQRERPTGFPKIESSGLKGSIREIFDGACRRGGNVRLKNLVEKFPELNDPQGEGASAIKKYGEAVNLLFGPESSGIDMHAGALGFTDARLLLFPVRSVKGIFAWITCPAVLHRFISELHLAGAAEFPAVPAENSVPEGCGLMVAKSSIILEEYRFEVKETRECTGLSSWLAERVYPGEPYRYWREKMKKSVAVLSDDDFRDFVNLSTEVITRVKIDQKTGTVQKGALFTEEYLPEETVLYSLALASPVFVPEKGGKGIFAGKSPEERAIMDFWQAGQPEVLQLGGNATTGKGLVRIRIF